MKTSKTVLDDDFIGGQGILTKDEEKALSDYFRQKKSLANKPKLKSLHRTAKRQKVTV